MFKSINVSTFTLASDSLLIRGFHFTIEDFLLAIRLLSEENSLLYMLTQMVCGSYLHFSLTYYSSKDRERGYATTDCKRNIKKKKTLTALDHPTQEALLAVWLSWA